ncbi:MAG: 50S ribosomal protein L6 [Candidatus Liptonbacteria bacterium]|nr:50S ribosomal protein L6 [Candidatus Liptonbacteria bacterium]
MSRLIKKPVQILPGVQVKIDGDFLVFNGPKGENRLRIPASVELKIDAENIWLTAKTESELNKAVYGTTWSLIRNSVNGAANGFMKVLEIEGVGYRAALEGKELVLSLGYVNPVRVKVPDGIAIEVEKNVIKVSGHDKDLVGRTASTIRALKKPEPYKGKGIRYRGEIIRRKVGKKAGATAAT